MIELVVRLRRTGIPVREMRDFVTMIGECAASHGQRMALLTEHRRRVLAQMAQLGEDLVSIDDKVDHDARLIDPSPSASTSARSGAWPWPGASGPAGTNEEILSRVLADRRDEVQLATKFGITGDPGDGGTRGLTTEHLSALDRAAELVQGGRNFSFSTDDWISAGRE